MGMFFGEGLGNELAGNGLGQTTAVPLTVATPAPINDTVIGSGKGEANPILGMKPSTFASVFGGLGASLTRPTSLSHRMGAFAQALGNQQMAAQAAQTKSAADQSMLKEYFTKFPDIAKQVLSQFGTPAMPQTSGTPASVGTPKTEQNA